MLRHIYIESFWKNRETSQSKIGRKPERIRKNGVVQQRKTRENAKERKQVAKQKQQEEKENAWVKSETSNSEKMKIERSCSVEIVSGNVV